VLQEHPKASSPLLGHTSRKREPAAQLVPGTIRRSSGESFYSSRQLFSLHCSCSTQRGRQRGLTFTFVTRARSSPAPPEIGRPYSSTHPTFSLHRSRNEKPVIPELPPVAAEIWLFFSDQFSFLSLFALLPFQLSFPRSTQSKCLLAPSFASFTLVAHHSPPGPSRV